MGLLALEQGNAYLAIKKFRKCIEEDSTFLEAYIPFISLDLYFGHANRAKKTIEKALNVNPEWQQGIIIRAILALLVDEDIDQFEEDVNTLIQLNPSNYHYYFIKAFLEMELERYSEAVKMFHKAYNLEVDNSRSGEFKFSSKFKKEEVYLRSLNYYFDHKDIDRNIRKHLDRGICELLTDNKKNALQQFDSANQIAKNAVSYMFIGASHKSSYGRTEQSIKAFSKSIELDSTNWAAYSYRAELLLEKGDIQNAYVDFSRVIDIKPRLKEGYKNRGAILLQNGHFRNAYKDFSYGIAIDQTDFDLYFNRAVTCIHLKENDEAIKNLKHILQKKPHDGEAHYLLHQCLMKKGDTATATTHLDSASYYSKYNEDFHKQLLEMGKKLSRPDLCLAAHNRLVKYKSYDYNNLLNRGKYYYQTGEYQKAITDLEKYVKRMKNSGEGYYFLANSFLKEGNTRESEKLLKKAEKLGYSQ